MTIHKEGFRTLAIVAISICIINILLYIINKPILSIVVNGICMVFYLFLLWFFRNPNRTCNSPDNTIVAPVDGKVVTIKETIENEFLQTKCIQISIFMSPLNVHVCRYPLNGNVLYSTYHKGKYLMAFNEKSSTDNERTTIVVEQNNHKVLFRQIAGFVARRIINNAKENDQALAGKEFGFIKFGSRMDIFVPINSTITVSENQTVIGAKDTIAYFK